MQTFDDRESYFEVDNMSKELCFDALWFKARHSRWDSNECKGQLNLVLPAVFVQEVLIPRASE